MRLTTYAARIGIPILLMLTLPVFAWLRIAEQNLDPRQYEVGDDRVLAVWVEHAIDGTDGELTQRVNISATRAEEILSDVLEARSWGLASIARHVGRTDSDTIAFELLEYDAGLAGVIGMPECRPGQVIPIGPRHNLGATIHFSGMTHTVGQAADSSIARLFRDAGRIDALRCNPSMRTGEYAIGTFPASVPVGRLAERLAALERPLYGVGFLERIRIAEAASLAEEAHALRRSWLTTVRWAVYPVVVLIVLALVMLDILQRRQGFIIRAALGATPRRQAVEYATALMAYIGSGAIIGMMAAIALNHRGIFGQWPGLIDAAALALVMVLGTLCIAYFAISTFSTSSRVMPLLQGHWNTGRSMPFLAAWGAIAAVLVIAMTLQSGLASRISDLSRVDLGYDYDALVTVDITVPTEVVDDQMYLDRMRALLEMVHGVPGVDEVSVIAPGPWRHTGLARVSGPAVFQFGVGPDIVRTLRLASYRGLDFDESDLSAPVVATQGVTQDWRNVMLRGMDHKGISSGLRWNIFEVAEPALIFRPITQPRQDRFEIVIRPLSGIPFPNNLVEQMKTMYPEAAISEPVPVRTILAERYASLTTLSALASIYFVITLAAGIVFTIMTFTQLYLSHQRELATRMCVGATPLRALARWQRTVAVVAITGSVVGAVAAKGIERILSSIILGFHPAAAGVSAIVIVSVVTLLMALGTVVIDRHLRRTPLHQLLR